MEIVGLVVLLGLSWMVLESRIKSGDEEPWPWQKPRDAPPF